MCHITAVPWLIFFYLLFFFASAAPIAPGRNLWPPKRRYAPNFHQSSAAVTYFIGAYCTTIFLYIAWTDIGKISIYQKKKLCYFEFYEILTIISTVFFFNSLLVVTFVFSRFRIVRVSKLICYQLFDLRHLKDNLPFVYRFQFSGRLPSVISTRT